MDRIYIITDRKLAGANFYTIISALLKEGFNFIQLRENDLTAKELSEIIDKILKIADDKINLVINDRVDLAYIYNVFGVQLKEVSIEPSLVKKKFPQLKIGLSVHDEERVKRFCNEADFFVYGNVFETSCKEGVTGRGIETLKRIVSLTSKPVYAIGGINQDNSYLIKEAGAYGIAIRSLVFGNKDYLKSLQKLRMQWG